MPAAQQAILGAAAFCALSGALRADVARYDCELSERDHQLRLQFDLDPASFSPPLDLRDPPRRQVSRVTLDGAAFEAEALMSQDGMRGFWAPEHGLMLTRAPDGTARMSDAGRLWHGQCKELH